MVRAFSSHRRGSNSTLRAIRNNVERRRSQSHSDAMPSQDDDAQKEAGIRSLSEDNIDDDDDGAIDDDTFASANTPEELLHEHYQAQQLQHLEQLMAQPAAAAAELGNSSASSAHRAASAPAAVAQPPPQDSSADAASAAAPEIAGEEVAEAAREAADAVGEEAAGAASAAAAPDQNGGAAATAVAAAEDAESGKRAQERAAPAAPAAAAAAAPLWQVLVPNGTHLRYLAIAVAMVVVRYTWRWLVGLAGACLVLAVVNKVAPPARRRGQSWWSRVAPLLGLQGGEEVVDVELLDGRVDGGGTDVEYRLRTVHGKTVSEVWRRYRDFEFLKAALGGAGLPPLGPGGNLTRRSSDPDFLIGRKERLRTFTAALAVNAELLARAETRKFLGLPPAPPPAAPSPPPQGDEEEPPDVLRRLGAALQSIFSAVPPPPVPPPPDAASSGGSSGGSGGGGGDAEGARGREPSAAAAAAPRRSSVGATADNVGTCVGGGCAAEEGGTGAAEQREGASGGEGGGKGELWATAFQSQPAVVRKFFSDTGRDNPFQVRGLNYLEDKVKVPAGPAVMTLVHTDLYVDAEICYHVASKGKCADRLEQFVSLYKAQGLQPPFLFILNVQIPGDPPVSIVAWWALSAALVQQAADMAAERSSSAEQSSGEQSSAERAGEPSAVAQDRCAAADDEHCDSDAAALRKFLGMLERYAEVPGSGYRGLESQQREGGRGGDGDAVAAGENNDGVLSPDDFRNERFKLIPSIVEGPFLVRGAVGNKPALLGRKLTQRYYRGAHYVETDVDVASSSVAAHIVSMCRGASSGLSVDLGIVLEGRARAELPERCLGVVRLDRLDLARSEPLFGDPADEMPRE